MCGENAVEIQLSSVCRGSPPRVRGKLHLAHRLPAPAGITPACAGKTSVTCRIFYPSRDHPRVCGENFQRAESETARLGSPPRVRGKRVCAGIRCRASGITPACAGKTLRKWRISVVDPSPQPRSSLTSRRADASIGSQRAPCAAPV